MGKEDSATQRALKRFNPLFTLFYSATHARQHNLIYVLDALDAYNKRIYVFKHYGAVPGELYKGLEYGQDNHVHGELAEVATAYVNAVIKNRDKKLSTAWKKGFDGVIDTYLGKLPETFTYQGKQYTPKSFGESLGLNSKLSYIIVC